MKKVLIEITILLCLILCGCSASSMLRDVTNYAQSKEDNSIKPSPIATESGNVDPSPTSTPTISPSPTAISNQSKKKTAKEKTTSTAKPSTVSSSPEATASASTPTPTVAPTVNVKTTATSSPVASPSQKAVSVSKPTAAPTIAPTVAPTPSPTPVPTPIPTIAPTSSYSAKTTSDTSNSGLIWNYFIGIYNNPYAVAGILGNIMQESSCSPTIVPWKDDSSSYGLCQWCGVRKEMLKAYADARDMDVGNLYLQLDFIVKEMNESYSSLVSTLLNATDATDAASQFCSKYEQAASFANCGTFARQFLEKYAKN